MQKQSATRAAEAMSAVLAIGVLAGVVMLSVWLRACWVARYHGMGAELRGVKSALYRATEVTAIKAPSRPSPTPNGGINTETRREGGEGAKGRNGKDTDSSAPVFDFLGRPVAPSPSLRVPSVSPCLSGTWVRAA